MSFLHLAVLTPFLFAIIVPFLYKKLNRIHTGWFVALVPLILFIYFVGQFPLDSTAPKEHSVSWIPSLGIHFTVLLDGLGLLFSLIITGIGLLVVLYSIYYMSKENEALNHFYVYLLMFMGAMLGVVLSDNILVLYVFWETTSVSSFLLIGYWHQRQRSRYGARKSLLITVFGGFSILFGILMLYVMTGTFSIQEMITQSSTIVNHVLFLPAMLLILIGAFTKSAQFPFHIWLPDAMEAPTPISAYLHSATMVKAGIYLVARLTPVFGGTAEWFWIVTIGGLLTLFWGSFLAVKQIDLKAMLAFSTISQLGLIMSLLGIGSLSLNGEFNDTMQVLFAGASLAAIVHLINHSIFKGTMFMVVGILDHETGTRDIRKLGGLMRLMPITFTLACIGGLSMAGLPPFGGFISKEMFFTGALTAARNVDVWAAVLIPIVAWVASIFTFVYCMILVIKPFTGKYEPEHFEQKPHEAPIGMLIAPTILASIVIALFFFPNVLSRTILEPTMSSLIPDLSLVKQMDIHLTAWHGFNTELFMTIGVVLAGLLLFVYLHKWKGVYNQLPQKFTLNHFYDSGLELSENGSARIMNAHMSGFVRDYLAYIFVFLIVLICGSFFILHGRIDFDFSTDASMNWYEIVLGLAMAAAALLVVLAKSRLTAILAVSAVGYIVSMFFAVFRAPDLALTQLVVETITTVLFVLCFYYLPKLKKEVENTRFQVSNLIIALGVGITLTLIGLAAQNHKLFASISDYYQNSYALAGARNMVNAILVDFRSFDTMMEIVVLFSAGIGVYTLVKLRKSKESKGE